MNSDTQDHAPNSEPAVSNPIPSTSSDHSLPSTTKDGPQHLENIRTISRVPGNSHYYEKNGLRTYGDDEDHDHEPPVKTL